MTDISEVHRPEPPKPRKTEVSGKEQNSFLDEVPLGHGASFLRVIGFHLPVFC